MSDLKLEYTRIVQGSSIQLPAIKRVNLDAASGYPLKLRIHRLHIAGKHETNIEIYQSCWVLKNAILRGNYYDEEL